MHSGRATSGASDHRRSAAGAATHRALPGEAQGRRSHAVAARTTCGHTRLIAGRWGYLRSVELWRLISGHEARSLPIRGRGRHGAGRDLDVAPVGRREMPGRHHDGWSCSTVTPEPLIGSGQQLPRLLDPQLNRVEPAEPFGDRPSICGNVAAIQANNPADRVVGPSHAIRPLLIRRASTGPVDRSPWQSMPSHPPVGGCPFECRGSGRHLSSACRAISYRSPERSTAPGRTMGRSPQIPCRQEGR